MRPSYLSGAHTKKDGTVNTNLATHLSLNTLILLGATLGLAGRAEAKAEEAYFVRCDRSTTTSASAIDLSGLEIAAPSPVAVANPDGILIQGLVLDVDPAAVALYTPLEAFGTVWLEDQVMTVWTTDAMGRTVQEDIELSVVLEASEIWLSTATTRTGEVEVIGDLLFDLDAFTPDGSALAGDAEIILKLATMATGAMIRVPALSYDKIEPEEID